MMSNTHVPRPPDDITSTLDLLENKSYRLQPAQNYPEIERQFDETIEWMQTTVLHAVLRGNPTQKNRCLLKVKELQKAMKLVKKQKFLKGHHTMRCAMCLSNVTCTELNFWRELQEHEHIEIMWANYLAGVPQPEFKRELQYDEAVLEFCYPVELMRETHALDGVPEFTLQFRGRMVMCLLCNAPHLGPGERRN